MSDMLMQRAELLIMMRHTLMEAQRREKESNDMCFGVSYDINSEEDLNFLERDGFDEADYQQGEIYERNMRLERVRDTDSNL